MNEQRAREGVEHLQAAALEVIHAMRAFLDIAEDVVRDPGGAMTVAQSLADVARAATGASPSSTGSAGGAGDGEGAGDAGVTRIRVS